MYTLRIETLPFPVPDALQKVLRAFPLETGSGGRGDSTAPLPAVIAWSILATGDAVVGNAWVSTQSDATGATRHYMNLAVYEEARSKGAASAAIVLAETFMREQGFTEVFAQVNSNNATTGLRVRNWLTRQGYVLVRENLWGRWLELNDNDILQRCPFPVTLRKTPQWTPQIRPPIDTAKPATTSVS